MTFNAIFHAPIQSFGSAGRGQLWLAGLWATPAGPVVTYAQVSLVTLSYTPFW